MPLSTDISAEKRRQAYDFYVNHPSKSVPDIAAFLDVSPTTFVRLRDRWGWPKRAAAVALHAADQESRAAAPRDAASAPPAPEAAPPSCVRAAALALATAARSHIGALMNQQRGGLIDHDKAAKALASYADTLSKAQALLEQDDSRPDVGHPSDAGRRDGDSRSIHELRDELARHLERIIAEEEARGSDGLLV